METIQHQTPKVRKILEHSTTSLMQRQSPSEASCCGLVFFRIPKLIGCNCISIRFALGGSRYPRRKTLTLAYDELASAPLDPDYLPKLHATRTFWAPPSKMVLGPHTGVKLNVRHFVEPYTAFITAWWACQLLRKRQTFDGNVATKGAAKCQDIRCRAKCQDIRCRAKCQDLRRKKDHCGKRKIKLDAKAKPKRQKKARMLHFMHHGEGQSCHASPSSGSPYRRSAFRPCVPMPPIITDRYDAHRTERTWKEIQQSGLAAEFFGGKYMYSSNRKYEVSKCQISIKAWNWYPFSSVRLGQVCSISGNVGLIENRPGWGYRQAYRQHSHEPQHQIDQFIASYMGTCKDKGPWSQGDVEQHENHTNVGRPLNLTCASYHHS